ncbi:diguanylate cyclase domain-containing protein [Meiothermus rufus]|uniref:diguanylate cyclase domain-containing protein n=1 Tax=Meiothermus rufus TaxID=604332 RepID=UPI000425D049|nr:diguanylate cyclase [Meiothermus rufus]
MQMRFWEERLAWGMVALCALGYALVPLFPTLRPYELPLLMVVVAALASAHSWWGGAMALVVALLVETVRYSQPFDLEEAFFLLLAAFLADLLGRRLRRSLWRHKKVSRQLDLLLRALRESESLGSQKAILKALPELVQLDETGHVSVWEPFPDGLRLVVARGMERSNIERLPFRSVVGRAYSTRQTVLIKDVSQEPDYVRAGGYLTLSELALPIFDGHLVVAILNLERTTPFDPWEVEGLQQFAQAVGLRLSQLAEHQEAQLIAQLSSSLTSAETLEGLAQRATVLLCSALGASSAALFEQKGERFRALGLGGQPHPDDMRLAQEGIPLEQGLIWEVYRSQRPYYSHSYPQEPSAIPQVAAHGIVAMALHPIPLADTPRSRYVLVLGYASEKSWNEREKNLLASACRTIGLALERILSQQHLQVLLGLSQQIASAPEAELYRLILQSAVAQVPGATAGSLLVWQNGCFSFRASVGFDLEALRGIEFSQEEQMAWYSGPPEDWQAGKPRILRGTEVLQASQRARGQIVFQKESRSEEIQTNLCIPIAYQGRILAVLNLDNTFDSQAFGPDSLRVAQLFVPPIAAVLHELHHRQMLENAASTDSLTGLPNRRAFDQRFEEEISKAKRYHYPISLLVMDLSGFKQINDRLGHAVGDQALVAVAQALQRQRRNGDGLFRWGGDEFAAILLHADGPRALVAARRYARAIAELQFQGLPLGVNIGIASLPNDGSDHDTLLQVADTRMYQAKAQHTTLVAPSEGGYAG